MLPSYNNPMTRVASRRTISTPPSPRSVANAKILNSTSSETAIQISEEANAKTSNGNRWIPDINRILFSLGIISRKSRITAFIGLSIFIYLMISAIYEGNKISNIMLSEYPQQDLFLKTKNGPFRVSIIADMDKKSYTEEKHGKPSHHWESQIWNGYLVRNYQTGKYSITWESNGEYATLESTWSDSKRGMELSDLVYFNGKLYTCDDRTGILFSIEEDSKGTIKAIPRFVFTDGNGQTDKGFKCEWLAVKDGNLYAGSMGKEWISDGVVKSHDPEWVKKIYGSGIKGVEIPNNVESIDWTQQYNSLRAVTNTQLPGYLIHEAVCWHHRLKKWFFLPRKVSEEEYDEEKDETMGSNIMISADESFKHVEMTRVGIKTPSRGFSAFRFIPTRDQEFVALKTEEHGDTVKSYITVMNLKGQILMEETFISDIKFEGIEFLPPN